jgi:hypothetical protein
MWRKGIHTGYWWESQTEREHWEDQDVGGLITLNIYQRYGTVWYYRIHLDQDWDQCRAPVNTVVNIRVP